MKRTAVSVVTLTGEASEALTFIADIRGVSRSDAIRQSLAIARWCAEAELVGIKLVAQQADGKQTTIRFRL